MNRPICVFAINPGPAAPPDRAEFSRYSYFENWITTDVVQTCWGNRHTHPAARYGRPNVRYHFTHRRVPQPFRIAWDLLFFVATGLRVFLSGRRFRAIVAYGTTKTAAAGLVLKWVTGAKLIIDVPGDPRTAFIADSSSPSALERFEHRAFRLWMKVLLHHVDRLKILFPGQLAIFPEASRVPTSIFADFVPLSVVPAEEGDERYLLFLGFPWYLKGVDLLIQAFQQVCDDFPHYRLKVVGHCVDRAPFELLRAGNPRIEFHPGVKYPEALALIARCTALVLPSRTEAMGRVLLEAMAARKPVVASRVGGVPHYITDGETGLLFEPGNVSDLSRCIRKILEDAALRDAMAGRGHDYVHREHGETRYAERFTDMLRETVG